MSVLQHASDDFVGGIQAGRLVKGVAGLWDTRLFSSLSGPRSAMRRRATFAAKRTKKGAMGRFPRARVRCRD